MQTQTQRLHCWPYLHKVSAGRSYAPLPPTSVCEKCPRPLTIQLRCSCSVPTALQPSPPFSFGSRLSKVHRHHWKTAEWSSLNCFGTLHLFVFLWKWKGGPENFPGEIFHGQNFLAFLPDSELGKVIWKRTGNIPSSKYPFRFWPALMYCEASSHMSYPWRLLLLLILR